MSKQENHNDPLERLFRKKAEEYNISYREEDWLKLEKQLDARDMKLYYRRRLRWLAAASVLILSLIGYYTFQNHNKINQLTEQLNQEVIQQDSQPELPVEEPGITNNNESAREETDDGNINQLNLAENVNRERATEPSLGGDNSLEEEQIAAEQQKNLNEDASIDVIAKANLLIERKEVRPDELLPERYSEGVFFEQTFEPVHFSNQRNIQREYYSEANGAHADNLSGELPTENASIVMMDDAGSADKRPSKRSRWSLGIMMSPDMSTAGSVSNFHDPGFKGGLLAEYSLTENLSLISGVTISNVKYKADRGSYNAPDYWNSGLTPDETRAVCAILDIPLNVKSNIFNFNNSRIFATAGVSSYIMLDEDYQFRYADENITGVETSYSESSGSQHWFSNAGFSVGIDYDIHPNWTLRAEPHLKVPIKGVGWADVELYSMGTSFSLNYRFNE